MVKAFGRQADSGNAPPNVLFIIADDLNTSLIHSYGNKGVVTPNLDKLAQRGRIFTRAYTQAPLCNPSRSSLMTGRYPHHLKIWTNSPHIRGVYPNIKTLPEYFKDHGYHTAGIGKIYHNWGQALKGDPPSWSEPEKYHWAAHYQDWYVPGRPYTLHSDLDKGPAVQNEDVPDEAYLDGRITNEAIKTLRELRETPFFLAVGFWKPHLPFNAPKKYWDLYDRNNLPQAKYSNYVEGVPDIAYVNSDEARSYTDVNKGGPIPGSKKQELRHGYLAAISYLDTQVGKVVDELDRLGLAKNTIIVFISDHGYHAGEHGQFGKWTNFEVGTRVPLIIVTPGIPQPGKATDSIAELVDLYPTLLNLCNLPESKDGKRIDGISLEPILKDPDVEVKSAALSQIARPLGGAAALKIIGSSIRNDRFRYNIWVHQKDEKIVAEELYDLSTDIYNAENLINKTRYKTTKKQLFEELMEMLKN